MSEEYQTEEVLQILYWDKYMSMAEIGDKYDVSSKTISYWMEKHDIKKRGTGGQLPFARYHTVGEKSDSFGYEEWRTKQNRKDKRVRVHRLLAVAEYGFEAVCGRSVRHLNGIKWDNRPQNIELMSVEEHSKDQLQNRRNPMKYDSAKEKMSQIKSGPGNHNWRGGTRYNYRGDDWEEQRSAALERDDHTCQECGVEEYELDHVLHVHHKVPYDPDIDDINDLENLVTLCPACHGKRELSGGGGMSV